MNMQQQLTSLRDLFMLFEDPKDKFVQLMDMAKESEQLKENEKVCLLYTSPSPRD